MRSHIVLVVAVASIAISCALSLPAVAAQPNALEQLLLDAANQLLSPSNNSNTNNNTTNNNTRPNTPSNNPNRTARSLGAGYVDPGGTWTSDAFPAGTFASIGGPGIAQGQGGSFKLPAHVVVDQSGFPAELGANVNGNRLVLRNNSGGRVVIDFILPPGSGSPGNNRPSTNNQPAPNNLASSGSGNVEVRNLSGGTVKVHYVLPSGRTYNYNGNSNSRLWINLADGRTDETQDIAENTRVSVDNYFGQDAFVPRNATLQVTINPTSISSQVIRNASPVPNPTPGLTPSPNPTPNPSPNPAPNPTANPAPNPSPNPLPVAGIPKNTIPKPPTTPLTSAVSQTLALGIVKEVKKVVDDFDRGSVARVAAIQSQLVPADFPASAAEQMGRAAKNGDPKKVLELFEEHRQNDDADLLIENLHTIATFREPFTQLLAKISAGKPSAEMTANIQAIKEQATNLGASGLADAMTLAQQELLIRDTINRAVLSSVLNVGKLPVPVGPVMVIHHPGVAGQANYMGTDGLILTRSRDSRIIVSKSTAGDALRPADDRRQPGSRFSSSLGTEGIIISNSATNPVLRYTLNGKPFTIQPNQTQSVAVGTNWQIEFSPGPNSANKKYTLATEGTYAFVVKGGQWDLGAKAFRIRLHNPANSNTNLNYVVDGTIAAVLPGATAEHKSSIPLFIQFDRGNSGSTATKLLQQSGDYFFSLNQDSKWDLFPGEVPASQDTTAGQVTIMRPSLASLRQAAGTLLFDFTTTVAPSGGNSLLDALKAASQ